MVPGTQCHAFSRIFVRDAGIPEPVDSASCQSLTTICTPLWLLRPATALLCSPLWLALPQDLSRDHLGTMEINSSISLLGIKIMSTLDIDTLIDLNLTPVIKDVYRQFENWLLLGISWFGRVVVIKMKVLP